jgi:hypothetical protein
MAALAKRAAVPIMSFALIIIYSLDVLARYEPMAAAPT